MHDHGTNASARVWADGSTRVSYHFETSDSLVVRVSHDRQEVYASATLMSENQRVKIVDVDGSTAPIGAGFGTLAVNVLLDVLRGSLPADYLVYGDLVPWGPETTSEESLRAGYGRRTTFWRKFGFHTTGDEATGMGHMQAVLGDLHVYVPAHPRTASLPRTISLAAFHDGPMY